MFSNTENWIDHKIILVCRPEQNVWWYREFGSDESAQWKNLNFNDIYNGKKTLLDLTSFYFLLIDCLVVGLHIFALILRLD